MSIDAFEKREQTLQLHANVLQAEQEREDLKDKKVLGGRKGGVHTSM